MLNAGLADGGLPHFDAECVGSIPTPAPIIAYQYGTERDYRKPCCIGDT